MAEKTILVDRTKTPLSQLDDSKCYSYHSGNRGVNDNFHAASIGSGLWIKQSAERGFDVEAREFYSTINGKPITGWKAA